jgi:putative hemolysin
MWQIGKQDRLEHFQAKWTPVRAKKMRQNKDLETRSDSIGTKKALAAKILFFPRHSGRSAIVRDLGGLRASLGRIGALEVRLATTKREIRKAQRLRYEVFYEQGLAQADPRGALSRRDICPFDRVCDHLLVVDHSAQKFGRPSPRVVGTYRLLRQEIARANFGFYTAREFDIAPLLARHADKRFLELGRSCVLPQYRSKRTLELLWRGIWTYVRHHCIDVMIGCASLEGTDPRALALPLSFLHHHAAADKQWAARARADHYVSMNLVDKSAIDARKALAALPPLVKGYLRVGASFGDGAVVDRQFGTTDILVIMPVTDIEDRYIAHFGSAEEQDAA